jgi:hypothetical protein
MTLLAAALSAPLPAALVAVTSSNDHAGGFFYAMAAGDESLRIGGAQALLQVALPCYGLHSVSDAPGWAADTSTPDLVVWRATSTVAWVVDNLPVTFAVQSEYFETAAYEELATNAVYPCATVLGEVYTTNGTLYRAALSNAVTSVNVIVAERVAFVGPQLPEPARSVLLGWMSALRWRRRRATIAHRLR